MLEEQATSKAKAKCVVLHCAALRSDDAVLIFEKTTAEAKAEIAIET